MDNNILFNTLTKCFSLLVAKPSQKNFSKPKFTSEEGGEFKIQYYHVSSVLHRKDPQKIKMHKKKLISKMLLKRPGGKCVEVAVIEILSSIDVLQDFP